MDIQKAAVGTAIVVAGLLGGNWLISQPSSEPVAIEEAEGEIEQGPGYACDVDRDCGDFETQSEAQDFFDNCGFSANYDPMKLDSLGVGDGVACESLP